MIKRNMTLQNLRFSCGFRPLYVAEQLGITYVQWHNLEEGKYNLDKLKREKIHKLFKVSYSVLLEIENNTLERGKYGAVNKKRPSQKVEN